MRTTWRLLALAALVVVALTASAATAAAEHRKYRGEIDGAKYRVEVPDRWNGTLVLYSHGYYPEGFDQLLGDIQLANNAGTAKWLLDHGYALAASNYKPVTGYVVDAALRDQIALLDWFDANVGRPRRTISTGQSLGAAIAILLTERHPDRFAGAMTVCGGPDPFATYNAGLDVTFAIRTLLAPNAGIDLVRPANAADSADKLAKAVQAAADDPKGRARLALAGAFNNVTGWFNAHAPRPTGLDWQRQQALWLQFGYSIGFGPVTHADMEGHLGGNPSWNVGIDYRRQLARSSHSRLVREAYREAGVDLRADLKALAAAPRIAPDAVAVRNQFRHVPRGRTPVPVLTLHTTGDGGAVPDQERGFADRVRRAGHPSQLRQLYIERGAHCSNSAAEEVVALQALEEKISTGRWGDLRPQRLNADANGFDAAQYHLVKDIVTFTDKVMPPAFTRFTPPRPLRPTP